MPYFNPHWLEAERKRWLRHDAHRFVRPDGKRWLPPEQWQAIFPDEAPRAQEREKSSLDRRSAAMEAEHAAAFRKAMLELRLELAWMRLAERFARLAEKAGFNPDQPRLPAGQSGGGQWTSGGAQSDSATVGDVTTPAHVPAGANITRNIEEAEAHRSDYLWFYDQVRNKGPWDYKQLGSEYEDFGNFNYGATGAAAGFSEATLLRAAGWAQVRSGTSRPEWGTSVTLLEALLGIGGTPPYGDDPRDQFWISEGIRYYDLHRVR